MSDQQIQLMHGECLELMTLIPDGSVDAIVCDLPYGTTDCAWDTVIPFAPLWEAYKRVIKPGGAIVLFADEPFTSALIMSQIKNFRHRLTWDKVAAGGFLNARRMPLKQTEDICIFAYVPNGRFTYNPILQTKPKENVRKPGTRKTSKGSATTGGNGQLSPNYNPFVMFPSNLIRISSKQAECNSRHRVHPTQKPVALIEYLISTYTNPGELVLDNCMGSGTTAVACIQSGRRFIGIEKDDKYFAVAAQRIRDTHRNLFTQEAAL